MTALTPVPSPLEAARDATRGRMIALGRVLISLVLMALILRAINFSALQTLGARFDPRWAVLAVGALALAPLISAPRWQLILARLGWSLPMVVVVRALYVGALFSQVLPSSVGGDVWRVWDCRRNGVPIATSTYSVLIERFSGTCATLICFGAAFPVLIARVGDNDLVRGLELLLLGCIGVCVMVVLLAVTSESAARFRFLGPVAGFARALALAGGSPRVVTVMAATAFAGQVVMFAAYFALAQGLGAPLTLADCIETMPPVLLIALFPISFGGWGLREGAFIVLLKCYGVPSEQALLLSVLYGLALLVSTLPGLVFWLMPTPRALAANSRLAVGNPTDAA